MEKKLKLLGIKQTGDIRSLIAANNNLPYKERDKKLSALYDIITEYNSTPANIKSVRDSKQAYELFAPHFKDLEHEEVWVAFLNKANKVLKVEGMFKGGLDSTIVDTRIIVKQAILLNATGIIIAHNHPSGVAKIGRSDRAMTESIGKVTAICDITLLDHIIVAGNEYFSFADEGLISNYK